MNLLSSLGTLVTYIKNITLPGLLAAAALALLLWPPRPYDRIPVVIDNHVDIASLQLTSRELQDDTPLGFSRYLLKSIPACTIREGTASDSVLARPVGLGNRATVALSNQLVLDDLHRDILRCVEEEQALQGMEEAIITNLTALIAARNAERDAMNATYQKYLASLSPLAGTFHHKLEKNEADVAGLQAHLLSFQRVQKERVRRVSELNRLDGEAKERLADNGRLRPTENFDAVLTGLGNHAVAFLVLVFAWGLLLDPINRAIFSLMYDSQFDTPWDGVRPDRTQWRHAVPSLRQATSESRHGWRSRPKPSLLAFALCAAAAAAVVLVSEFRSERSGRLTATVLCADWRDRILTYEARVTAPGGKEVPKGQLDFLETERENTLATRDLRNGKAAYVADARSANRTLFAKYRGSRGFASSASEPLSSDGISHAQSGSRCTAFLPDLTRVPTPDLGLALVTCLFVMCSALIAAYCTPSILRRRRAGGRHASDPTPDERRLTCEEKLDREWPKLSQPEYAIGQGIILRTDYEALQNSYYSQSLISVGSIVPVALLILAFVVSPELGLNAVGLYTLLWAVVVLLVISGVDRRHKYEAELKTLIASAFLKRCTQKEGDNQASGTDLSKRIAEVLTRAKVVSHTNLHISVADSPPTPAGTQAEREGGE